MRKKRLGSDDASRKKDKKCDPKDGINTVGIIPHRRVG